MKVIVDYEWKSLTCRIDLKNNVSISWFSFGAEFQLMLNGFAEVTSSFQEKQLPVQQPCWKFCIKRNKSVDSVLFYYCGRNKI